MKERLQKKLAALGIGSRRTIESWIRDGRIKVNGKIAVLGEQVDDNVIIHIDDRKIDIRQEEAIKPQVLMYHKPEGEIVSRDDPEGRVTVFQKIPKPETGRWINIGRLDYNTSGLLLFTNDGELANRLTHPSYQIPRHYAVRVLGEVDEAMLKRLRKGVKLEDGMASFEDISFEGGEGANKWYRVMLREGRNREVRRLWESQGVKVSRLMRVKFAEISLPKKIRPGQHEHLSAKETIELYESVKMKPPAIKDIVQAPAPDKSVKKKKFTKKKKTIRKSDYEIMGHKEGLSKKAQRKKKIKPRRTRS